MVMDRKEAAAKALNISLQLRSYTPLYPTIIHLGIILLSLPLFLFNKMMTKKDMLKKKKSQYVDSMWYGLILCNVIHSITNTSVMMCQPASTHSYLCSTPL